MIHTTSDNDMSKRRKQILVIFKGCWDYKLLRVWGLWAETKETETRQKEVRNAKNKGN